MFLRRSSAEATPSQATWPAAGTPEAATCELQRLHDALDALGIGIIVCDDQGHECVRNAKATSLEGDYQVDALLRAAVDDVTRKARQKQYVSEIVEMHGPVVRVFTVTAKPLTDGGMVITIEDISDRHRVDAMRKDFVANVSHELRTPIGALVLLTESLHEEQDPDAIQRINEHIAAEAKRAGRLVEELLGLSRLESRTVREAQRITIDQLVASAARRIAPLAKQQNIAVVVDIVDSSLAVDGDFDELLSAVVNLLENAVKYSDSDSTVTVSATVADNNCHLTVIDNGIGIPAAALDRVFERFYRVDRARSRNTGGAGLGLSIVRHVAVNHGGDVRVMSREGEGSAFTLTIPLAQ